MKRLISMILSAGVLAIVLPATALAAPATTDVSGVVTDNGKPVAGAHVTVVCDNNAKHTTTDGSGSYLVTYPIAKCANNTKATAVATKGGLGGVNSGNVNQINTKLNIAIVNVSLPEFGVIAGFAAAIIGGGAFLVIRRRQLGAN
jgi:hypothetical protein